MPVLHMQTEAVRNTGQQINQMSELLTQQVQQISARTQQLANEWQGPSATMFDGEVQTWLQQARLSAEAGVALNQKVQWEVDEWELAADMLGAANSVNNNTINHTEEALDIENAVKVPKNVLNKILTAEENWENSSFFTKAKEYIQDNALERGIVGLAIDGDESIGRYNMRPSTAEQAIKWAKENHLTNEYNLPETLDDQEIIDMILTEGEDSKLAELYLLYLKNEHPQLKEMSWEEIKQDDKLIAKLYSGYMGAGGDWDKWKSDLEPGPVAKERMDIED